MITVFNQKELLVTTDLARCNQVRAALTAAKISHQCEGEVKPARTEYHIYVRKQDYERAKTVATAHERAF